MTTDGKASVSGKAGVPGHEGELLQRVSDTVAAHCALVGEVRETLVERVGEMTRLVVGSLRAGGKVLVAGNGGSAADAQHLAAEFVGRFTRERRGFPAVALTVDSSILTAVANDYGFDRVFARQIDALGCAGDIFIAISTSGNSPNVLEAVNAARTAGMKVLGFLGRDGGAILAGVDCALVVPSWDTARVQEVHALAYHCLCDEVEKELAGDNRCLSRDGRIQSP